MKNYSNCCESNFTVNQKTLETDCVFLNVEINDAPITEICELMCSPLHPNTTNKPSYVFQILENCHKIENCLKERQCTLESETIKDRCVLSYTGDIDVQRVIVDLDCCQINFEGFSITDNDKVLNF